MPFFLYVNGVVVHDEAQADGAQAPVSFKTKKEGEAFADALFEKTIASRSMRRVRRPLLKRSDYIVATEPPDPPHAPED